jgi:hypothetical protein
MWTPAVRLVRSNFFPYLGSSNPQITTLKNYKTLNTNNPTQNELTHFIFMGIIMQHLFLSIVQIIIIDKQYEGKKDIKGNSSLPQ